MEKCASDRNTLARGRGRGGARALPQARARPGGDARNNARANGIHRRPRGDFEARASPARGVYLEATVEPCRRTQRESMSVARARVARSSTSRARALPHGPLLHLGRARSSSWTQTEHGPADEAPGVRERRPGLPRDAHAPHADGIRRQGVVGPVGLGGHDAGRRGAKTPVNRASKWPGWKK